MSVAETMKLLIVPMSFVVAVLLAIGCLGIAQLYKLESARIAYLLRQISYGWFANATYLQAELITLLPIARVQGYSKSHVLAAVIVFLSGIASATFAVGSERYLRFFSRTIRLILASLVAGIMVAPLLVIGAGHRTAAVVFTANIVLNLGALLFLAAAFSRLTQSEKNFGRKPRALLVLSLLAYAMLQLVYFLVRMDFTGPLRAPVETVAFAAGLGCKAAHLIGLMFLGSHRVRRITEEETRIRREEEELRTFVGELVHELQTPASHLSLQLEQLEKSVLTKQNVREETRMTASIVRQIMAIVKAAYELRRPGTFTADDAPYEVLNVNNVIQAAFMGVKAAVKRPRGSVSFQPEYAHEPDVLGSRSRLFQLFSNLIKNSFDAFTTGRGMIRIATAKKDGRVIVTITDDGEGIDPAHLSRVRGRGFSTRVAPGRGNGLFIAEQVVREHNGQFTIESPARDGRGTRITVDLPGAKERVSDGRRSR
jgi:signal transduction histidine kinase